MQRGGKIPAFKACDLTKKKKQQKNLNHKNIFITYAHIWTTKIHKK